MNDYMTALHQRFYREPDFSELEEEIEQTHQEVRDCLDKMQRRRLMHLSGQLYSRVQAGLGDCQGTGSGWSVFLPKGGRAASL